MKFKLSNKDKEKLVNIIQMLYEEYKNNISAMLIMSRFKTKFDSYYDMKKYIYKLEALNLVSIVKETDTNIYISPTKHCLSYYEHKSEERKKMFIGSVVAPIIVALITTLVTMLITA